MIGAWLLFPVVLLVLALGCGLLLERLAGIRIPGALLVPAGLAVVIVAGHFTTATDATAELTVPLVCALAVAGFGATLAGFGARTGERQGWPDPWLVGAAVLVFAIYGAPVIASGDPTLAGFIRLDDTATWLALTDRVMEHGHSLDGLAPSTYEATLAFNLGDGYPVGVFIPLGVGSLLTGIDSAWLIQPYMSLLAACIALSLWEIVTPLVPSRPLRAAVAALAAQPALLVGYVQWGGVKEVAAVALIALCVAVAPRIARDEPAGGWVAVLAVGIAALLAVLSLGGLIWVLPALLALAVLLFLSTDAVTVLRRGGALAGAVALLSLPLLAPALLDGRLLPPTSSSLTDATAQGNLIEPLGLQRLAGVWPAGDFRLEAVDPAVAVILVVIVCIAAAFGLWFAVRSKGIALALYGAGIPVACLVLVALGSPWVDGKAMATASPALLALAATAGAVAITGSGRLEGVLLGGLVLCTIAIGVLWSNALAYRDVNLAPYDQLAELEDIGERIEGQGPALMTEYNPFGARHFLREADAEGVSELRRSEIPMTNGHPVGKGQWADTDRLSLPDLLAYRTLVLRRSPLQSRPPSPYELTYTGDHYEVWQRPAGPAPALADHLPLGDVFDPASPAPCDEVERLVDASGGVTSVPRPVTVPMIASDFSIPRSWGTGKDGTFAPVLDGSATGTVRLPEAGLWQAWIEGSIRGRMELLIDGESIGSVRHQLENYDLFTLLGEAELDAGRHSVELAYEGATLAHPGSGGAPEPLGPLIFTTSSSATAPVERVGAAQAVDLCRTHLDWLEPQG